MAGESGGDGKSGGDGNIGGIVGCDGSGMPAGMAGSIGKRSNLGFCVGFARSVGSVGLVRQVWQV
jgi:hypothetical protein